LINREFHNEIISFLFEVLSCYDGLA